MMERKLIFLIVPAFCLVLHTTAQPPEYPGSDSLLNYFIREKTTFNDSDPLPAATEYGGKKFSFPWLYLDQKGWHNLKNYLDDPYFEDIHDRNILSLKELGKDEMNKKSPDFDALLGMHPGSRIIKRWLQRATVAWYITEDPVYLEMAKAALRASCDATGWSVTSPGRHHINSADLTTGELLYNVSFGYDALYPYLDEQLKRDCMKALIEKGIRAYLEGYVQHDWWVNCDFNWNSALHGNAGIAAMVIRDANPELSDYVLKLATEGLPYMIKSFYPDGGYIEGVMYQGTAIGHLTDFIVPFYKLSGNDLGLLENKDFHNTISFWMYMFAPDDRAYNFSDCHDRGLYGIAHSFWWAHQLNRPEWTWDQERRTSKGINTGGLFNDVESFWYRKPHQQSTPPDLSGLRHFTGIDWATWRGEKSWLAFRGGFNGGNHDNDDLGNIILGYGRDRFLVDPGYGANKASEHNCITVRGHEQTDCATSYIQKALEHEEGFYLVCDIQDAFPHTTSHYNRHVLLIDDAHLLLIDDVMGSFNRRVWVNGHFQTRYPVNETETGWKVEGPEETCNIHLLFDFGPLAEEQWRFMGPVTKLIYKDRSDRIHAVQPVLFSFDDARYTFTSDDKGFTIEINGKIHRFVYKEGALVYLPD